MPGCPVVFTAETAVSILSPYIFTFDEKIQFANRRARLIAEQQGVARVWGEVCSGLSRKRRQPLAPPCQRNHPRVLSACLGTSLGLLCVSFQRRSRWSHVRSPRRRGFSGVVWRG